MVSGGRTTLNLHARVASWHTHASQVSCRPWQSSQQYIYCLCRKPPHEEDELLKQALLGADIEAPGGKKKKRPWCGFLPISHYFHYHKHLNRSFCTLPR